MFTSRAEYRLLLRHSNADLRLMQIGHDVGLVESAAYDRLVQKKTAIKDEVVRLNETRPQLTESVRTRTRDTYLHDISPAQTIAQILRRQESSYRDLLKTLEINTIEDIEIADEVELQIKYEGYIRRQLHQIGKFKKFEQKFIPQAFDYDIVSGFSREVREKLKKVRPETIGQASRISGVTPAAMSLLMVAIEKYKYQSSRQVTL
jgi:tRNA uridine 5-carboxymethylaminomethyl modification enzyme